MLLAEADKVEEYLRDVKRMLGGKLAFGVGIWIDLKKLWAFSNKKVFRKLYYTWGCRSQSLEWISCAKGIICIISLIIKWAELWSEGFCELWMIGVFDRYKNLREYSLWDINVELKI